VKNEEWRMSHWMTEDFWFITLHSSLFILHLSWWVATVLPRACGLKVRCIAAMLATRKRREGGVEPPRPGLWGLADTGISHRKRKYRIPKPEGSPNSEYRTLHYQVLCAGENEWSPVHFCNLASWSNMIPQ
jgi:hypothetical protein